MEIDTRNRLLGEIAETLKGGRTPESISVRELIGWFNALRRGTNVNWQIRRSLEQAGLVTAPDFESAHIDGRVQFALPQLVEEGLSDAQPEREHIEPAPELSQQQEPELVQFVGGAGVEPAYRVSRLLDPRLKLVTIGPDALLEEAVTLLLRHDYPPCLRRPGMVRLASYPGFIPVGQGLADTITVHSPSSATQHD
jgi:hypothetical protein